MRLANSCIELLMKNANTCRDSLDIPGGDCFYVPHGILMGQRFHFHVEDFFHVLVSLRFETAPNLNPVIVNDADNRETHKSQVIPGTK